MGFIPKLQDYDIKVLAMLGNQADDALYRLHIKTLMIQKILQSSRPLFYLVSKFSFTDKILREAYAESVVILMKDRTYDIDEEMADELVGLISLDTLVCYGMESKSIMMREKCKNEFCRIALEVENKEELNRKINLDRRRVYKIKSIRKGDKNDKH